MFFYSQMPPSGTRFMLIFSIPLFLASVLAGLVADSIFDGALFVVGFGVPFLWSFAYSKSLRWFVNLNPAKPAWQFLAGATLAQLVAVALLIWVVA
jgi:hypothetical protein